MRTKNSIINVIISVICYSLTIIISFILKRYFIFYLGNECLGINGLFSNIISMMSIAELGIGNAIVYNLYRLFSKKKYNEISQIVCFHKRIYYFIIFIIVVVGIFVSLFLDKIVVGITSKLNIYVIFWLFILDSSISYLFANKKAVLIADQKNFVINIIHTASLITISILQIIFLIRFHNYYIHLLLSFLLHIIEYLSISIYVNQKYEFISFNEIGNLPNSIKSDIVTKVKGLLLHKIASVVVMGTDNIIIAMTKTLGIIFVGYYSNYLTVINCLNSFIAQAFDSVTSSVGNLLVETNKNKSYEVYKQILFINASIYIIACSVLISVLPTFICLWIGENYILDTSVLFVLVINLYVQGMKRTCGIFQTAAGIFYENRYVPLFEAILNLIFSLLFVKLFGLMGVCLGTIVSSFVHWGYSFPKYIYGLVFDKGTIDYIKDYLIYVIIFIISILTNYYVVYKILSFKTVILGLIVNLLLSFTISSLIFFAFLFKSKEFRFWKNFFLKYFDRIYLKNKI